MATLPFSLFIFKILWVIHSDSKAKVYNSI
jgi:hypothetical protein